MATIDRLTPLPLGSWIFGGHLGRRVDTILTQRITSGFARDGIHPELVATLRARVDDIINPGHGMWQGEFWGKWIISAVEAARYLQDDGLRDLIAQSVDTVIETQEDTGYLGTYRNPDFLMSRGGRGNNWNIWGRKYILWGLLAAWELLGDERILAAASRMTNHLMTQVGPGRVDIVRTGKLFGLPSTSILTPVVMLYEATGEQRYLAFAEYIVDQWARHPTGPPDILHQGLADAPVHSWFPDPHIWAKSYEFMSCVEGLLHLYRATGRTIYRDAVIKIYHQLRKWERSLVGSISFNDKFVGSSRLLNVVGEICDVVYWNRLSFELFALTGDTVYADEFELSLYNALLTGMNREGTWGLRRLRLSHQHVPAHRHCDLAHQQCCVANAPRGLLQAAEMAWMTDDDGIALVHYNDGAGTATTPGGHSLGLKTAGGYPVGGRVTVSLSLPQPERFTLRLRIPGWSLTSTVSANGAEPECVASGSWHELDREWHDGDSVVLDFDMSTHVLEFDATRLPPDDPLISRANAEWARLADMTPGAPTSRLTTDDALPHSAALALMRGPLVMARDRRLGVGDHLTGAPDALDTSDPWDLLPVDGPEGIWAAFEAAGVPGVRFCDFASAGNTWNVDSEFSTWMTVHDPTGDA